MLHLENFFEKSFALLLTTPNTEFFSKKEMTEAGFHAILELVSEG